MAHKSRLSTPDRVVAAALAAVWIGAGVLASALAAAGGRWLMLLPGLLAAGYGLLWLRVFITGRRLTWPPALFRRRDRS